MFGLVQTPRSHSSGLAKRFALLQTRRGHPVRELRTLHEAQPLVWGICSKIRVFKTVLVRMQDTEGGGLGPMGT